MLIDVIMYSICIFYIRRANLSASLIHMMSIPTFHFSEQHREYDTSPDDHNVKLLTDSFWL